MDTIEELKSAIETMNQRREGEYANAYKKGGAIFKAFFPNGVTLKTEADFSRYNHFMLCIMKLNRYSQNIEHGGHYDSAHDLINYAAMLTEFTDE